MTKHKTAPERPISVGDFVRPAAGGEEMEVAEVRDGLVTVKIGPNNASFPAETVVFARAGRASEPQDVE